MVMGDFEAFFKLSLGTIPGLLWVDVGFGLPVAFTFARVVLV